MEGEHVFREAFQSLVENVQIGCTGLARELGE
jgi:hypothetical protein